jgi:hypothetical protein
MSAGMSDTYDSCSVCDGGSTRGAVMVFAVPAAMSRAACAGRTRRTATTASTLRLAVNCAALEREDGNEPRH